MLRFARRALASLLFGAAITLLSAWAIHGVQFWRTRASVPRFVNSASNQSFINLPGLWLDDSEFAEQIGAIGYDEEFDPRAARRANGSAAALAITGFYISRVALIDPDAAWRRHRRVTPDMIATPSRPVGFGMFLFTQDRFGWNPGESLVLMADYDEDREESIRTSGEVLAAFNTGWPWRSMQTGTHHVVDAQTRTTTPHNSLTGGITLWTNNGQGPLDRFALPLFPLWPGFAINTLVFATGLAVLWHVPVGVRRMSRRRAGCCLACGYTIEGLDTCPECGKPVVTTEP